MITNVYSNIIIGACWMVFLLYWFISSFFVKESMTKKKWPLRIAAAVIIAFIIIISKNIGTGSVRYFFTQTFIPSSLTMGIIGPVLTVLGLCGAIWARTVLGRNWSGYVTYKKDHELVTSGPYKLVRHPIYSSLTLMFIGTFLVFPTFWALFLFLFDIGMFIWRTKKEEAIMLRLFGKKYEDYMKRTKRLVPFIW